MRALNILVCLMFFSFLQIAFAKDDVKIPVRSFPSHLKISKVVQVDHYRIASLLAEGLIEFGDNFSIYPVIAKDINWSSDNLSLKMSIRDLKFSDGSNLTLDHVLSSISDCIKQSVRGSNLSFKQIKGFKSFMNGVSKNLEGLKKINDKTLKIVLDSKAPLILDELTHQSCSITKMKNGSRDFLKGAIGYGPYKIQKYSKNKFFLTKNPFYKGKNDGPEIIKIVETKSFGNIKEMTKNSFDLILSDEDLIAPKGYVKFKQSPLRYHTFTFNNSVKPFNNSKLRKAVRLSIDFEELQKKRGWKRSRMQNGLIPYGMKGYERRINLKANREEANRILKELGYSKSNPFRFEILIAKYANSHIELDIWPTIFKTNLIDATIKMISQKELMKRRNNGKFQTLRIGKAPGSVEPHLLIASFLKKSRFNTAKVDLPKCEKMIKSALIEMDKGERFTQYKKIESCLLDEDVIIPLATVNEGSVFIKKPWKLTRTNKYLLYPYRLNEWIREKE